MHRPTPVHRSITPAGMQSVGGVAAAESRRRRWQEQRRRMLRLLLLTAAIAAGTLVLRTARDEPAPPATGRAPTPVIDSPPALQSVAAT